MVSEKFSKRFFTIRLIISGVFCFLFLFSPSVKKIFAQSYRTDYVAEYFPSVSGESDVKIGVVLTNLRSDSFVQEFSLSIPKNVLLSDILVSSSGEGIDSSQSEEGDSVKIKINFPTNTAGKNSRQEFAITFRQKNLFREIGSIDELIVPTLYDGTGGTYKVILHLPSGFNKKISIAKPTPSEVKKDQIIWQSITTKKIYAVFGDSQAYKLKLNYTLNNDQIFPQKYTVAFPPETLYQKIYVESIIPFPDAVSVDADGNYLGIYTLSPHQKRIVSFTGYAQIRTIPQDSMKRIIADNFTQSKNYLTKNTGYWALNKSTTIPTSHAITPEEIYKFVVSTLSYDGKSISSHKRGGANGALADPTHAICTEFTDLFVALSRKNGIPSREIEGVGYSTDSHLRPQSFLTDVLHSWPEYFNSSTRLWTPVDPTWENTSGIDYFSSFDLNHIVFVIHGKDSVFPQPAGMYKEGVSKDVSVLPVDAVPSEVIKLQIETTIKSSVIEGQKYTGIVNIANRGNIFIKNAKLRVESDSLKISPSQMQIPLLAPGEKREWNVEYEAHKGNGARGGRLTIYLNETPYYSQSTTSSSAFSNLTINLFGVMIGFLIITVVIIVVSIARPKS